MCKFSFLYLFPRANGEAFLECYHANPSQCVHEAVLELSDSGHYHILVLISRAAKELLDIMDKEAENRLNMLFRRKCSKFFGKMKIQIKFLRKNKDIKEYIFNFFYLKFFVTGFLMRAALVFKTNFKKKIFTP